ncbi:hypothetical protein L1987_55168 [Smallanthus sonchifolius]|uniref:Uncharacterized protein n=1 Tax=Smallanthus sonchifolius TaxID=185202 RepID=A0ACB9E9A9_9ASTR|nr:hypothetical protein L1987_55168 [Smallanthus sonchifolius]
MSTTSTSSINMSVATVDKSLDEEQWGLATWAQDFIKAGNLKHIVDSEIRAQISPKCLKDFVRIVERCLHNNPKQRPTMAEVVVSLESVLTVQEKTYRSLHVTGGTILGRMFYFVSLHIQQSVLDIPQVYDANNSADAPDISNPLSWEKRLRIMIGVARGLTYLHSSKDQVVCRGVQSSDILLDQDFNAKLIDFGLGKSCLEFGQTSYSSLVATRHIVDPEYTRTGQFNVKSDIYGFGVVLMEALTALPAMGANTPNEQYSLVDWACQILANKRNLKEIMDPRLENNYPLEGAFECGALKLKCVANDPSDRPSSEEVLQNLERIYAVSLIWKDYLEEKT